MTSTDYILRIYEEKLTIIIIIGINNFTGDRNRASMPGNQGPGKLTQKKPPK